MTHAFRAPSWTTLPRARQHDLVVSEIGDETMVFDQQANQLHRLDAICTAVWSLLDGTRTIEEVSVAAGITDERETAMALDSLAASGLLDRVAPGEVGRSRWSRRRLLRQAGVMAAVPTIISVTAPLAAQASSPGTCSPNGSFAENPACCNSFLTCDNGSWVARTCAPGTSWDQSILTCNHTALVQCGARPPC